MNSLRVGHGVGSGVGCKKEWKRKIENLVIIHTNNIHCKMFSRWALLVVSLNSSALELDRVMAA